MEAANIILRSAVGRRIIGSRLCAIRGEIDLRIDNSRFGLLDASYGSRG